MDHYFTSDLDLAAKIARDPGAYNAEEREDARHCLIRMWMSGSGYRNQEAGRLAHRLIEYDTPKENKT